MYDLPTPPDRTKSGPSSSSSQVISDISPTGNSFSPVMIPPPLHASNNLSSSLVLHDQSRVVPVQVSMSPLRRPAIGDDMPLGSYNPSESLLGTSPSPSSKLDDGDFFEEDASTGWIVGGNSGKFASSFPSGGFDSTATKSGSK
ncbi:uncharacterized protein LOC122081443 isoform X2 [Macadamia integrifolia]|uniref:uncharacterized protein LOC122081443 isoform X2 n=1 Tax=Macadamia integrifolia TaxID=60698 RepID=UPI001C4EEB02|nr:uncharacterized protein LOC122081443 isoform X2 [Macadamia integrifolia]